MKITLILTDEREEEIVIYAKERYPFIAELEQRLSEDRDLFGTCDGESVRLSLDDIELFTVKDGKIYAVTGDGEYALRERLYMLEERFGDKFVKINQSTLAHISKISRFKVSVGGALCVVFKCGYLDYVSRRQLKKVKQALGI